MPFEVHDDHFPQSATDAEWLALVGRNKWVAVTRDNRIRRTPHETYSVEKHSVGLIVIRMKNAKGPDEGDLLVRARHRIARYVAKTPPPFVAKIDGSGLITTVWPIQG